MKRKNLKKFTAAAMSAVLVAGMLSGCGKKAETTTEDGKEVVELTWYQVGDTQKDQQMVIDKVNEYTEEKIGVKLNVISVGWGDYNQKMQVVINTGDKYDIPYEEIHTLEDLEPWLELIKEKEPDVVPMYLTKDYSAPTYMDKIQDPVGIEYGDDSLTVQNVFETEKMQSTLATMRKYFEAGYINKDAATASDDKSIKRFVTKGDGQPYAELIWSKDLGYDVVATQIMDTQVTNASARGALTAVNKNTEHPEKYTKTYAEKLLYIKEGQSAPMHFHWNKMEDIINRGGGNVLIRVYNSTEDGQFADTDVTVHCDGREFTVPAGTQVKLCPGESITIYKYMYHDFELEPGTGPVLLGEVSMCNDDENDNRFYEPIGRFPIIEEDEPAYRLLCNEYPQAK